MPHLASKPIFGNLLLVDKLIDEGGLLGNMLTNGHLQVSSLPDSLFGLFVQSCYAQFYAQVFLIQTRLNKQCRC